MKKVTKDPQLEEELQELYLESKHWLSDLHFEEDEIRFLKKNNCQLFSARHQQ